MEHFGSFVIKDTLTVDGDITANGNVTLHDNSSGGGASELRWNLGNYIVYDDIGNANMEIHALYGAYLFAGTDTAFGLNAGGSVRFATTTATIPSFILSNNTWAGTISNVNLSAHRIWNFPNSSGTVALTSDIMGIYGGSGTVPSTVISTLTNSLQFNYATGGGFLRVQGVGEFRVGSAATEYMEYLPNTGIPLTTYSSTATLTGFMANRAGTTLTMVATSAGGSYIDVSSYLDFTTNSTNTHAQRIHLSGLISIGTTATSSLQAGAVTKLNVVASNIDAGIHTLSAFENSITPTVNNSDYARAVSCISFKYGAFNTYHIASSYNIANNQGTGAITELFATHSYAANIGNATIGTLAGFYSDKQVQSGTIAVAASIIADTTQISGGTISNLYGLYVKTPANVSGGTIIRSIGVYIESNTIATDDYGFIQGGIMNNGFGIVAPTATGHFKGAGATSATFAMKVFDQNDVNMLLIRDDGRISMNSTISTADRLKITAGSSLDGAINISCSNLANNGYAILAQGGSASANYYGFWSVASGGTDTVRAFYGTALDSGTSNNYGGYFSARNGSSASIGVYAVVAGGDSVNSTDSAAVYATNGSTQSTSRKGFWTIVTGSVNLGSSFGVKTEVDASGTSALNYGIHVTTSGSGSGRTNYGAYLDVNGGSSAVNYGIVTSGTLNGLGTLAPTAMLELVGGQFFVTQDSDTVGTATVTIDFAEGNNKVIDMEPATGNVTVTLSNPKSGAHYTIKVIQGSGGYNLIWPAAVKWPAGTAPVITVTNDAIDLIRLYYDGSNYLGTFNQAFA